MFFALQSGYKRLNRPKPWRLEIEKVLKEGLEKQRVDEEATGSNGEQNVLLLCGRGAAAGNGDTREGSSAMSAMWVSGQCRKLRQRSRDLLLARLAMAWQAAGPPLPQLWISCAQGPL